MVDKEKSIEILQIITGREIAYQKEVALSVQTLTEDERSWIRQVVSGYESDSISPFYFHLKKAQCERNANKEKVRKELDDIRKERKKFIPQELIKLRDKKERESQGFDNFEGIYIIHNLTKDIYYVGQSKEVFGRAYQHFVTNPIENSARYSLGIKCKLPEIYNDYHLGEKFNISLIPLAITSFSTLDDLEYNAISAYNAFVDDGGYNRTNGNIINKGFFKNDDQENAANLILDKIKGTDIFSTLTNDKLRIHYVQTLSSELLLPSNHSFRINLVRRIKAYQKASKKRNLRNNKSDSQKE